MLTVEIDRVLAGEPCHLAHPADDGLAIRMCGKQCRIELLGEKAARLIVRPFAALFLHDGALGQDGLVRKYKILHAVCLKLHHERQAFLHDALEIGRVILRGEGVFVTAIGADDAAEGAIGVFGRALEHQMFKKMRNAGLALRLVRCADLVPHHVGDDGSAAVRDHHDLHAVRQGEGRDIDVERACAGVSASKRAKEATAA